MWTRFFPAVEQARRLVNDEKKIGDICQVFSDFNFNAADSEDYPKSFVYNHNLGGGASFLVAPYPLAAATLFFPGQTPESIKSVGQIDQATGVDLQGAMVVSFPPTSDVAPALDDSNTEENTPKLPGAGVATLSYGMLCESAEETVVIGTKGRLTIRSPGHCPTNLSLTLKGEGRGAAASTVEYEYQLPPDTEEIIAAGGYFYPNSAGFAYEAAAAARCIAAGKTEPPQYTLAETLVTSTMVDAIRSELGVKSL